MDFNGYLVFTSKSVFEQTDLLKDFSANCLIAYLGFRKVKVCANVRNVVIFPIKCQGLTVAGDYGAYARKLGLATLIAVTGRAYVNRFI
jgi:hypothetical protein